MLVVDRPSIQQLPTWRIRLVHVPSGALYNNATSGVEVFTFETTLTPIDSIGLASIDADLQRVLVYGIKWVMARGMLNRLDKMQLVLYDGQSTFSTKLLRIGEITVDVLFNIILSHLQSSTDIDLRNSRFTIVWVKTLTGGNINNDGIGFKEFVKSKRALYSFNSTSNNCLSVCISMGLLFHSNLTEFKLLSKPTRVKGRLEYSKSICQELYSNEPVALTELSKYEFKFKVNINVLSYQNLKWLRASDNLFNQYIFLLYNKEPEESTGHYVLINPGKVGSLWGRNSKLCYICLNGYSGNKHACIPKCLGCRHSECDGVGKPKSDLIVKCFKCNSKCFSQDCLTKHKCIYYTCPDCRQTCSIDKRHKHVCGFRECINCNETLDISQIHKCYVSKQKQPKISCKYIFYDFECCIGLDGEHVPALVIAQLFNNETFYQFTTVEEFVYWCLKKKGFTFIAHNGGRYDVHFIKKELLRQGIESEDVIKGRTIISSTLPKYKIKFIDSFKFITTSLRNFPKTFNLQSITKEQFKKEWAEIEALGLEGPSVDSFVNDI